MNKEKEFVPYEIALAMKDLGFNEKCLSFYNITRSLILTLGLNNSDINIRSKKLGSSSYLIAAPLYQQAFRWFFDKYHWTPFNYQIKNCDVFKYGFSISTINGTDLGFIEEDTIEKAELECLKKLIELSINFENQNV